jgi:hypothetical protein
MEIEVIQNIESVLPIFEITKSDVIPIPNTVAKIYFKIQSNGEAGSSTRETGSGFGNSETNRQVEQAAISYVTTKYQENGWTVESVESKKCGYDLLCSKDNAQEHVEVKGVQGELISFPITEGEVKRSRSDEKFILYIVTSALLNPVQHRFTAKEFQEEFTLEIISYFASLKHN